MPFEHEKCQQRASQAAELAGALPTVEQNRKLSTQLNAVRAGHAGDARFVRPASSTRALVTMSRSMGADADAMSLIITCECGYMIRGDSESTLIARAREHLQANHPAIANGATDADLLDMASMTGRGDSA